MQPYVQAPSMPQQQVYDQFAAPGAPQMQMQYGVRALYTPPHNQYDQFAVPPPPRTQMQYGVQSPYTPPDEPYSQFGVQAPSTYPQLSGPVEAGAASFYRTQGCMQDPVGKWFKLLPGFDKRTYHFTPLRILPNREIVAIVDGKVIWPEAARIAYGVAPQGSTSGQFMNRSMPAAFPIRDTSVYQQNMPTMTNNIPAGMPMQNMPAYQQNLPAATHNMPSGAPTPPLYDQFIDPQLREMDQGVDMVVPPLPQPHPNTNFNMNDTYQHAATHHAVDQTVVVTALPQLPPDENFDINNDAGLEDFSFDFGEFVNDGMWDDMDQI